MNSIQTKSKHHEAPVPELNQEIKLGIRRKEYLWSELPLQPCGVERFSNPFDSSRLHLVLGVGLQALVFLGCWHVGAWKSVPGSSLDPCTSL